MRCFYIFVRWLNMIYNKQFIFLLCVHVTLFIQNNKSGGKFFLTKQKPWPNVSLFFVRILTCASLLERIVLAFKMCKWNVLCEWRYKKQSRIMTTNNWQVCRKSVIIRILNWDPNLTVSKIVNFIVFGY